MEITENRLESADVKVYPNPTVNVLNMEFGDMVVTDLMIVNVTGYEILRRKKGQDLHQIDVSSLPSGMYLVQMITDKKALITKRVIKAGL